jgi:hypothetical protein
VSNFWKIFKSGSRYCLSNVRNYYSSNNVLHNRMKSNGFNKYISDCNMCTGLNRHSLTSPIIYSVSPTNRQKPRSVFNPPKIKLHSTWSIIRIRDSLIPAILLYLYSDGLLLLYIIIYWYCSKKVYWFWANWMFWLGCAVRFRLKRNDAKIKQIFFASKRKNLFFRLVRFEAKHWKSQAKRKRAKRKNQEKCNGTVKLPK